MPSKSQQRCQGSLNKVPDKQLTKLTGNDPYLDIGKWFDHFMEGKRWAWAGYRGQKGGRKGTAGRFFRPGYQNHLVQAWLPSIEGMAEKLERGAKVADVGCGHGITTTLMAEAFPNSEFIGLDFHEKSIEEAKRHANSHELENLSFEVCLAKELPGTYDLVTIFDCLHDMGDPVGGMKHIRQSLKEGGACMIVEPIAGDCLSDNLNPVSRLYYAASAMVCVPTSLVQETGAALGAQAGEKRLKEVVMDGAGFSQFNRISETPFNLVLEARP